jgi:hypothetical protein
MNALIDIALTMSIELRSVADDLDQNAFGGQERAAPLYEMCDEFDRLYRQLAEARSQRPPPEGGSL